MFVDQGLVLRVLASIPHSVQIVNRQIARLWSSGGDTPTPPLFQGWSVYTKEAYSLLKEKGLLLVTTSSVCHDKVDTL